MNPGGNASRNRLQVLSRWERFNRVPCIYLYVMVETSYNGLAARIDDDHALHGQDAIDGLEKIAENFIVHNDGSVTYISHKVGPDNRSAVVHGNADDILAKVQNREMDLVETRDHTNQSHKLEEAV